MNDIIFLFLGLALGYIIGRNKSPTIIVESKDLEQELQVAKNLNKSLLDDKHELQQKVWKLQGRKPE